MAAPVEPSAFGEAEATEWFKTAIRQGGALEAAFAEAVKSVLQAGVASDVGEIPTAIKATAETFETQNGHTDTVIVSLEQRVIACEEFVAKASKQEADLDAAFSRSEVERSTDAQEWLAGWNRLFVDKDWLANVSAQMADPAMVNAVSACMANPNNPEAQKIKDAIGLRNAPKTTLRELCLSSFGGSPDRFRAFMSDKAASICFFGLRRVSEAINLRVQDVHFKASCACCFIRKQKSDPCGKGQWCFIPFKVIAGLSPAKFLQDWMDWKAATAAHVPSLFCTTT
ncbi:unnamed protein product, partial [Prorocentrum cordatum]